MTHPTKPDRRGPPTVSEEDKARALALAETRPVRDRAKAIAAEFARIREEVWEAAALVAEREEAAVKSEYPTIAAAIRSRGEGDANEKG